MSVRFPIRVGLVDEDFSALQWNADLLTRDLRTLVCLEAELPQQFIDTVYPGLDLDVIIIDTEYLPACPPLKVFIQTMRVAFSKAAIVCLSQYGMPEALHDAYIGGAREFLLKNEIRMEIASAVVQVMSVDFLITPGVRAIMQDQFGSFHRRIESIRSWKPHPGLTPQLRRVFTLRVLYGMTASLTAQKIYLSCGTVEKYMQYVYQKLSTRWGDDSYLKGIDLDSLPAEIQAFHSFNLPPRS